MNERVRFVATMLEGEETFGEVCERFGISRKQGYKWKERYDEGASWRSPIARERRTHIRRRSAQMSQGQAACGEHGG